MVYPLQAADTETQHAFDVTLPLRHNLEVMLHSRVRTEPAGEGFSQIRGGPIVSWGFTPRITLLSGYYFSGQEREEDFIGGHRLFGGAEAAIVDSDRISFEQRFLTERFLSRVEPDFSRHRFRSRLSAKGVVAPYTAHEFLVDSEGWRSNRHLAALRWNLRPAVEIDVGYFYEHRRRNAGPHRHVWFTSVHLKLPSPRVEAD
jgi:hypothetical protein